MKRLISIFLSIFTLLTIVACNQSKEPELKIDANVSKLSEKEYESVGTYKLKNPSKDDFRKLTFNLKMNSSSDVVSRKIIVPQQKDWKKSIDSIDKKRYWFGEGFVKDNDNDNAEYFNEIIFYSKGLSEVEIKQAFNSTMIKVSWTTKDGKTIEKDYEISDLIVFEQ